jgi:hypothetical protein
MKLPSAIQRLVHQADRLCAYDHCRLPLPWFAWSRGHDPISRLHRHCCALDYGTSIESVGPVRKILAALLHFIRGTRELVIVWNRQKSACATGYKISPVRQLRHLFVTVFRYNLPPKIYYVTRLFRLERSRWLAVFSHHETTLVLAEFEHVSIARNIDHWTKSKWAAFCAREGIPTVPLAAEVKAGQLHIHHPAMLQAGRDIFLKPDRDFSSQGGVMLEWEAPAQGWRASGAISTFIPENRLADFLTTHAKGIHFVVQPRLRNTPALADLTARALLNARIVTVYHPTRGITVLMAGLRIPPGDQPVSDVLGSTVSAPINLETGILEAGESAQLQLGLFSHHPHNGAQIEGRLIPDWPEMRARAIAGHQRLTHMPSIGWDLVCTEDGIFILEANSVWNAFSAQHWGRLPLGETVWPETVLAAQP